MVAEIAALRSTWPASTEPRPRGRGWFKASYSRKLDDELQRSLDHVVEDGDKTPVAAAKLERLQRSLDHVVEDGWLSGSSMRWSISSFNGASTTWSRMVIQAASRLGGGA